MGAYRFRLLDEITRDDNHGARSVGGTENRRPFGHDPRGAANRQLFDGAHGRPQGASRGGSTRLLRSFRSSAAGTAGVIVAPRDAPSAVCSGVPPGLVVRSAGRRHSGGQRRHQPERSERSRLHRSPPRGERRVHRLPQLRLQRRRALEGGEVQAADHAALRRNGGEQLGVCLLVRVDERSLADDAVPPDDLLRDTQEGAAESRQSCVAAACQTAARNALPGSHVRVVRVSARTIFFA